MRLERVCAVALGLLLSWGSSAGALTVTLNPGLYTTELWTRAIDATRSEVVRRPTALPVSITDSAANGAAAATASFDLTSGGFELRFDVTNPGTLNYGFADAIARIHFSVDRAVDYLIDGRYDAVDPDGEFAVFAASLTDFTGGGIIELFSSGQHSCDTPNESFVVGGMGGDCLNELRGSASGTLLPGRDYFFFANALLGTQAPPARPGTASGFARISFVPEPAPGFLLGAGLLALARHARRRPRPARRASS